MENMERFTAYICHRIRHHESGESMENVRFNKEGYFHILVFYGLLYFIREIENICSRVRIHYRNTRGNLGELEIQFLVLPNFRSCFYNCMYGNTENVFYFLTGDYNTAQENRQLL